MASSEDKPLHRPSFPVGLAYALFFPVLVALIFALIRAWFAAEPPVIVVNARSNQVAFTSTSQQLALFPVRGAVVVRPSDICSLVPEDRRLTALVRAPEGTRFEYIALNNSLLIALDAVEGAPRIDIEVAEKTVCTVEEPITLVIPPDQIALLPPLPVVGLVEIGSETVDTAVPIPGEYTYDLPGVGDEPLELPRANVMTEATAQVYARTSRSWDDGRLVPVDADGFRIPRGSRLVSTKSVAFGNAVYLPDERLLDTEITISAEDLVMYRAGAAQTEEAFAVGAMSRAFGDPTLAPLLVSFAVAGFLTQIFLAIQQAYRERDK